jgi:hypothetical protein
MIERWKATKGRHGAAILAVGTAAPDFSLASTPPSTLESGNFSGTKPLA